MSVEQSSRPTHGADVDRTEEWASLRQQHLRPRSERPAASARGVHPIALLSTDVEAARPFFFDIGHGNSLAFFDFPGLDLGPYAEVLGGLHHLAISVEPERWEHLKAKLGSLRLPSAHITGTSLYFSGPDGERLELIADPLGEMYGSTVG